jgi:hypothetical protein
MDKLTIDSHVVSQICDCCHQQFTVSRGSVYENGELISIYLAGLHCCEDEKPAFVGIGLKPVSTSLQTYALNIRVDATATYFEMRILEPDDSPWSDHEYLGQSLSREEALASPYLKTFFRIADEIVEVPEVRRYLMEEHDHSLRTNDQ